MHQRVVSRTHLPKIGKRRFEAYFEPIEYPRRPRHLDQEPHYVRVIRLADFSHRVAGPKIRWKRAAARVRGLRFHDLRHQAIIEMVEANASALRCRL